MTAIDKRSTFKGQKGLAFLFTEVSAAPLIVFRVAFGLMMFLSTVRFMANGWVDTLYVQPKFFFTFYGFEWVKPLGEAGMYTVFGLLLVTSLLIALGVFYRAAIVTFFLLFTYVELIDKTNYLNHYYFISVVSFLLCLLPDTGAIWNTKRNTVPRWSILMLQLQMAVVYFFAGVAKINADWLLHAMPLKIWLPTKYEVPVIGSFLGEDWLAYVFSWCGMLFDLLVAFFLFNRRTVWYAYAVVIVFHVLTAILFPFIGVFPFVMIVCATIFLPATFHEGLLRWHGVEQESFTRKTTVATGYWSLATVAILALHFSVQLLLPLRSHLYSNNLFYHEQGYRFSWRVMLMEKAGHVFFYVKDGATGKAVEVNSGEYLTMQQQKQMSTQPDMILQFAHYLKQMYASQMQKPEVYAEAYVTVNGRSSRLFIDPTVNLAEQKDGFITKKWILASVE